MKTNQNQTQTAAKTTDTDPKRKDGAHVNDPNREKSINGGHQGSTGQRDKHDR